MVPWKVHLIPIANLIKSKLSSWKDSFFSMVSVVRRFDNGIINVKYIANNESIRVNK